MPQHTQASCAGKVRGSHIACRAAGRKLSTFPAVQGANVFSGFNAGQLNQAAVQQIAQAVGGAAANGAVVSQGNILGAPP